MNAWMFVWTSFLIGTILVYGFVVAHITWSGGIEIGIMLRRLDEEHKKLDAKRSKKP